LDLFSTIISALQALGILIRLHYNTDEVIKQSIQLSLTLYFFKYSFLFLLTCASVSVL
jgi:hypothetical protein